MITWSEVSQRREFWAALDGRPVTLIMDFDGTLSPFVPHPPDARPYPGVPARLDRLAANGVRLVIVTGRDCRILPDMLGLDVPAEVWGSHGGEHLAPDGTITPLILSERRQRGVDKALRWAESVGYARCVELKPGGLAFNLRGLPEEERQEALERARTVLGEVAANYDMQLRAFDGGQELRSPEVHKGQAVARVQAQSPPDAALFYLGDDDTDEDAFAALDERGTGILVRCEVRESRADWWLRPPEQLLAFLDALLETKPVAQGY